MEVGSFVQSRRFEKSSAESIVNGELMLIGGLLIFIGVLHAAWGGAIALSQGERVWGQTRGLAEHGRDARATLHGHLAHANVQSPGPLPRGEGSRVWTFH